MMKLIKNITSTKLTRREFISYLWSVFIGAVAISSIYGVIDNVKKSGTALRQGKRATSHKDRFFGEGVYGS